MNVFHKGVPDNYLHTSHGQETYTDLLTKQNPFCLVLYLGVKKFYI